MGQTLLLWRTLKLHAAQGTSPGNVATRMGCAVQEDCPNKKIAVGCAYSSDERLYSAAKGKNASDVVPFQSTGAACQLTLANIGGPDCIAL
jgi:hypothetical protein